jgi:hypothetical protein
MTFPKNNKEVTLGYKLIFNIPKTSDEETTDVLPPPLLFSLLHHYYINTRNLSDQAIGNINTTSIVRTTIKE